MSADMQKGMMYKSLLSKFVYNDPVVKNWYRDMLASDQYATSGLVAEPGFDHFWRNAVSRYWASHWHKVMKPWVPLVLLTPAAKS